MARFTPKSSGKKEVKIKIVSDNPLTPEYVFTLKAYGDNIADIKK
ncbi:hypothetical protein [Candidatus Venteria ishoeyi]|nr:hypothetical protein [Candidatus Venteria ishoeyi]